MADIPIINLALYAQTDVGMVRSGNEDNFLILDLSTGKSWTANEDERHDLLTFGQGYYGSLLAVSDGMGGALAGEVASRMAVETVRDRMLQLQAHNHYSQLPFHERLRLAVEEANYLINQDSVSTPEHKGLGATFTAVGAYNDRLYFAQVGDSRAYLLRKGRIIRVTKDQSLVQQLIDAGQITEEEAETHSYRNVILQALGAHNSVNVEVNSLPLRQLDTLLLCSDGLSGKMHADEIARIVSAAPDLKSACQELINLANERGGEDNITVVVAQFSGAGLAPPDRETIEPESLSRAPDTPTEIDLGDLDATTRELDRSLGTTSENPTVRATQPIKPATSPTSSTAPTSSRTTGDNLHSGDHAARRGPITAVFAAPEFDGDEQVPAIVPPAPSVAPVAPSAVPTAPTPSAAPTSLNAARRTELLAEEALTEAEANAARHRAEMEEAERSDFRRHAPASTGNSKLAITLITILVLLGMLFGGLWYYRRQQAQKVETQNRAVEIQQQQQALQARIGGLRDRIAVLNKRVAQAPDTPAVKDALQRLEALSRRLDQARDLPPEKIADAIAACDEVEKTFISLEREFESLSHLPVNRLTNRLPVVC